MQVNKSFAVAFAIFAQCISADDQHMTSYEDLSCDSHGPAILVHSDDCLSMPSVIVSIVFRVGKIDVPIAKSGIVEVIARNLIDKELDSRLVNLGITYNVNCTNTDTEICAHMHPKNIKKFFELIKNITRSIEVENLDICKRKIIIEKKLINYGKYNSVSDNIFAQIYPQVIFNESTLRLITVDDIRSFFNKYYRNGVALITICGNFGEEILTKQDLDGIKKNFGRSPQQKSVPDVYFLKNGERYIHIENKFAQNSINYAYTISDRKDKKLAPIFLSFFSYELFKTFIKARSFLSSFYSDFSVRRENDTISVSLFPRKDVSLSEIKKLYKLLVRQISTNETSKETLSKIAEMKRISISVQDYDMYKVHSRLRERIIGGADDCEMLPTAIENTPPEELKKFASKILYKQPKLEITTQYRPDR